MKIETTVQRTELTVERTETLRISRSRRFVYERCSGQEQDVKDAAEGESLLPATLAELESFT